MISKRTLPRERSARSLVGLTWLLASLATAAVAHGCIDVFGALGAGGDAYDDHAHATVAPIGLAAVALVVALLWRSAARSLGQSQSADPALLVARRFATMSPIVPVASVALGGFGTLVAMEFTEQLSAFRHIAGIAEALGGNACVGLAIIVVVAALLTVAGLRTATALLYVSVSTVGALYALIVVFTRVVSDTAILRRALRRHRRRTADALGARSHGLRAPPTIV